MIINLPVPPSVNALYANRKGGRGPGRYKTATYKAWLANADTYYLAQKRRVDPVSGPAIVTIRIPANTRGDVSNRIKAAEDFLVSRGITNDDRHNHKVSI